MRGKRARPAGGKGAADHFVTNLQAVTAALTLADATLSPTLGRTHPAPVFSTGSKHGDLHKRRADPRLAYHRAVTTSDVHTVPMVTDLPQNLRWRAWLRRIEAVLSATASPIRRDDLTKVVGQGVSGGFFART